MHVHTTSPFPKRDKRQSKKEKRVCNVNVNCVDSALRKSFSYIYIYIYMHINPHKYIYKYLDLFAKTPFPNLAFVLQAHLI